MARYEKSSDPLPFIQVDRAAKQIAAMLAGPLEVSFQHALGGLVQFWGLCGERRDLERLIEKGVTEVLLSGDEVLRRFRLAMGKPAELNDLVDLHLLEARDAGEYRVRGMSRFFEPLIKAKQRQDAAVAGGKASAKARRDKDGSAQPRSGAGSAAGSEAVRTGVPTTVRTEVRSDPEPSPEATPEPQPNTDGRGQTSEIKEQIPPPPAAAGDEEFWDRANDQRRGRGLEPEVVKPARWALFCEETKNRPLKARLAGHLKYLRDTHFEPRGWAMAVFVEPGVYGSRIPLTIEDRPEMHCALCGGPAACGAWDWHWCYECLPKAQAQVRPEFACDLAGASAVLSKWLDARRAAA